MSRFRQCHNNSRQSNDVWGLGRALWQQLTRPLAGSDQMSQSRPWLRKIHFAKTSSRPELEKSQRSPSTSLNPLARFLYHTVHEVYTITVLDTEHSLIWSSLGFPAAMPAFDWKLWCKCEVLAKDGAIWCQGIPGCDSATLLLQPLSSIWWLGPRRRGGHSLLASPRCFPESFQHPTVGWRKCHKCIQNIYIYNKRQ